MTDEPGKEASEAKQAVPGKSDAKGSAPKKFAPRTAKSQNKFAPFNTLSELLAPPAQKRR
jgi:hypothetical protein